MVVTREELANPFYIHVKIRERTRKGISDVRIGKRN